MATYDLASSIPASSSLRANDILNCSYTGNYKSITLPQGTYKLECWGAQGGGASSNSSKYGGNGGYSVGTITLTASTLFYLVCGGQGVNDDGSYSSSTLLNGGYNGGGAGRAWSGTNHFGGGGGGGTDIRIQQNSLYARVIVAGGGGGGSDNGIGGYGGGTSGETTEMSAGTQNSGYSFGSGGQCSYTGGECGGGGGGWYGGVGASSENYRGGGGSGYVYTSSTAGNYPSGCLLNSSYYLTSASTIAGNQSFLSPTGTYETGHTGNGYCRITVISIEQKWTITYNANGGSSTPSAQSVNKGSSVTLASAINHNTSSTTFILTGNGNGSGSNTSKTATQNINYSFAKWNTNSSGTGTDYTAGGTITPSTNLTLYARWNSTTSYTGNRVCDIPIPSRPNYTFTGWNTRADGTGTAYSATSTTTFTSATTLYAQWQEIIQYIPYIYNGSNWVKYEIRTNNGTNFNDKYKGNIYL